MQLLLSFVLAGVAGFEPTNAGIKIPCLTAWRHPNKRMGREMGFEPTTSGTTIRRSNQLGDSRHLKMKAGAPGGIRTPDTRLRRPLLYPTELQAHILCVASFEYLGYGAGDGNRTHVSSLEGWCSTIELHPHFTQCFQIITIITFNVKLFILDFQKK